jgi:surface antigen
MLPHLCLAAALGLAASLAHAGNLGFLGTSPLARMTAEDVDILYRTALDTLDNAEDGKRTFWENASTNASGSMRVLESFEGKAGERCRRLQLNSRAQGVGGQNVVTLCKQGDGRWKAPAN